MGNFRVGSTVSQPSPTPTPAAPLHTSSRFAELVYQNRPTESSLRPAVAAAAHPALAGPQPLTELGRQLLSRVARGERYMEGIVRQGLSGRAFTNADLLAMQAQVYRYTQEIELVSKLVDRGTSTVKTVLQQNG